MRESDLKYGVVTITDVRSAYGLPPVPWGDGPWLPRLWAQTNDAGRADMEEPKTGRNKPDEAKARDFANRNC